MLRFGKRIQTFDPPQKLAINPSGKNVYVAGEKGDRGGE